MRVIPGGYELWMSCVSRGIAVLTVTTRVPGDVDGNGVVDFADLLAVLAGWGPCEGDCPADLDGNGRVEFADLLLVLSNWS